MKIKEGADPETRAIQNALEVLITADGKGKKRKATVLLELCETINPNKVRDAIKELNESDLV